MRREHSGIVADVGTSLTRTVIGLQFSLTAPLSLVTRVDVKENSLQLLMPVRLLASASERIADDEIIYPDPAHPGQLRLIVPIRVQLRGGITAVVGSGSTEARHDRAMIKALGAAHTMAASSSREAPFIDVAPGTPYLRRIIKLAYLAPDLQRMILDGRQPAHSRAPDAG